MDSHATDQCNDKHAYRLGPSDIDALQGKWLARLPASVHRADRAAGHRHDMSIL